MYIAYAQELEYNVVQVLGEEQIEPITSTPLEQSEGVVLCEDYRDYGCSCMLGLVEKGYPVEKLNAEDLQPDTFEGNTGDIILFYYAHSNIYHAGTVTFKFPSENMEVYECNYKPAICDYRIVKKDDPAIRGYIHDSSFPVVAPSF